MKLNFEVVSIVLIIKYLSQNFIKLSMLGMFWNPHDKKISKLSLIWWRIHWDIQDWRQGSIKKKEILKTLYLLPILATYIVALSLLSMYLLLLSSCYVRTSVIFTIALLQTAILSFLSF